MSNEITTQGVETPTPATVDHEAAIRADIAKIEKAITSLQNTGKDLFSEEIMNLNQKLGNAQKELESLTSDISTDINEGKKAVQTLAEKFREKQGVSVWVAVIGGGYIVWQVGSAILRALEAF